MIYISNLCTRRAVLILVSFLISINILNAQFTITENFKGNTANSALIIGGNAYLTSGINDPQGQGWLRLTKDSVNQQGNAYISKSFPSSLGVLLEFEYKAWRSKNDKTYNGADGFSIFLFDADSTFRLGGYGGSLGYAPIYPNATGGYTPGLAGGYVGIGVDEYGNFSNPIEGRNGGPGLSPNSIALRGPSVYSPATRNNTTTTPYLAGYQIGGSNGNSTTYNGVDYNTVTSSRPTDAQFYRKIQIKITPTGKSLYTITVNLDTIPNGPYFQLISYTTTQAPPKNLKLGFAASTGGGYNNHEVRNFYATTPGGVRLTKSVDQASTGIGNQIKYTLDVYNSTTAPISGLKLLDTMYDGNRNIIPANKVRIDSIVFNNLGDNGNKITSAPSKSNPFSATLNMAAATSTNDAHCTFTTYATVLDYPTKGTINNVANLDYTATGISDPDTTNNMDSAHTKIVLTDLSIKSSHTDTFYVGEQNQNLLLSVINNGIDSTGTTTTVNDTLPTGLTYAGNAVIPNGWQATSTGNIVSFTYNGSLKNGAVANFTIPVNVATNLTYNTKLINNGFVSVSTDTTLTNNISKDTIIIYDLNPGVVEASQNILINTKPKPFTESTPASKGLGSYTYQWQKSSDNKTFSNISGATNNTYTETNNISVTTYYRRLVNVAGRSLSALPTDTVVVTVKLALPITLLPLSGKRISNVNTLTWATSMEINIKGFEIQRSTDNGNTWQVIGFSNTEGNGNSSNSYSFSDPDGVNYSLALYKLRVVGTDDATETYSNIVSISGESNVSIYPNPADGTLYVQGISGAIYIYDVIGRKLISVQASSSGVTSISVSKLIKGTYFIKTEHGSYKFIKK